MILSTFKLFAIKKLSSSLLPRGESGTDPNTVEGEPLPVESAFLLPPPFCPFLFFGGSCLTSVPLARFFKLVFEFLELLREKEKREVELEAGSDVE